MQRRAARAHLGSNLKTVQQLTRKLSKEWKCLARPNLVIKRLDATNVKAPLPASRVPPFRPAPHPGKDMFGKIEVQSHGFREVLIQKEQ